jgi:hypothetical protein
MKSNSMFDKILVSTFITIVLGFLLFFLFYSSNPGIYFITLDIVCLFLGYELLYTGLIILLLRLLGVIKSNSHLAYVLLGVANICMWSICIVLFYLGKVNMWWLHQSLMNLLIGVLVIGDGLLFRVGNGSNHSARV